MEAGGVEPHAENRSILRKRKQNGPEALFGVPGRRILKVLNYATSRFPIAEKQAEIVLPVVLESSSFFGVFVQTWTKHPYLYRVAHLVAQLVEGSAL